MVDLARDGARQVGQQVKRRFADLFLRDRPAQRRVVLVPFQDVAEIADARGRQRLDRAREIAFTRMPSRPRSSARYMTEASSAALATPMTL
jgi:predicted oxidoreductase